MNSNIITLHEMYTNSPILVNLDKLEVAKEITGGCIIYMGNGVTYEVIESLADLGKQVGAPKKIY